MPEPTVYDPRAQAIYRLREALLELHSAGLALAPYIGYIDASVATRWDEAMGAADDVLKRAFDERQPEESA